jgi:hypothetical protein
MIRAMPYARQIFGLAVHSDLDCPELLAADPDDPPDIEIRLDTLDAAHDSGRDDQTQAQIAPGVYQFVIDGVARYRVEQGRRIRVQPFPGADPGDVRLWLLGTALGALLHQRGLLPLHVSAVGLDGGAHAFCGPSGAGKSTLAAALDRRGLPLLTDDVGLAIPEAERVTFYLGFPRIKLWRDALEHFGLDHRPLIRDLTRADKYHLRLDDADGFHDQPLSLRRLYLLAPAADEDIRIDPIRGREAIALMLANTYRPGLVRRPGASTRAATPVRADRLAHPGPSLQPALAFGPAA